jgi:glycosyltransferase involved in cell wall biosynthesis
MKAMFMIFHGFDPSNGISKKILYQIEGLRACGIATDYVSFETTEGHQICRINNEVLFHIGDGLIGKVRKRVCFGPIARRIVEEAYDFVYIRSDHNANPFTIRLMRKMKESGAKVVLEIPTYPYDQEYVTFLMKVKLFVDKLFRHQAAKLTDGIVTFSNAETIFGKKTIRISNGIDFNAIPLKTRVNDISKELHIIGVAEIHFWHGFDRLINGLVGYYAKERDYKVFFHLVGPFFDKNDEELFHRLVTENGIDDYVIFHGPQNGKALDELFEECDFAIGSLGRHRSGITYIKTLKNREYAARGLSFVYSETDSDFDSRPYILKAPADESPIDIESLITFRRSLTMTPEEIRESVRDLSWEEQMRRVIETVGIRGIES